MVLLNNQAFAQKLIALQSGDKATFYTDLDTALYYAKNGDDIYLPGGYIKANKTTLKIDKAVNIIGVGHDAYSNAATENTIIQTNAIMVMPWVNGGSLSGISVPECTIQLQNGVSNYSINRIYCSYITIGSGSGTPPSNISIVESAIGVWILNGVESPNSPLNVTISNCLIGNIGSLVVALNGGSIWNELTCKNSLLQCRGDIINSIQNSLFENCIFRNQLNGITVTGLHCTFRNCLLTCQISEGNAIYNCIGSQDINSIFINDSYHLLVSSPGKNAGKDGTDIGIYGGRYPWKDGGLPVNPHIETFNVAGKTDSIGNLRVKIKVAAQEN